MCSVFSLYVRIRLFNAMLLLMPLAMLLSNAGGDARGVSASIRLSVDIGAGN